MAARPTFESTVDPLDTLRALPAFTDNYIWTWIHAGQLFVVDPGDAGPVLRELEARNLTLGGILVTHHHPDHVAGISTLLKSAADIRVFGPAGSPYKGVTDPLHDGDHMEIGGLHFDILETPGHTLDHIAYFNAGALFCGDTLFAGGCGRLFEGTPEQMHVSLQKLAALPATTPVCCTHEYTQANLMFAAAARPKHRPTLERLEAVRALREADQITLPSRIDIERATNPFLCVDEADLREQLIREGRPASTSVETFASLRAWKDAFRG